MRFKKTAGILLLTSVLLTACNNDDEYIGNYSDGLQQLQKIEGPTQAIGQKIEKLENSKKAPIEKISGSNIPDVQNEIQQVLDKDQQIAKEVNKEEAIVKKSKKKFNDFKNEVSHIEDEEKQKAFEKYNQTIETRYDKHEDYIKGYKDVVNKEQDLFKYLQGQSGTQEIVDQKSKALNESRKKLSNNVKAYTDAIKKSQRAQRDVQQYLNE
ncbi:YkyA family protein [Staphylococcus canis]|uniref:Lipoprotein n=1 Tax=Staphylococcus canis TaxID=2724942 RepID=A0ABS0TAV8_9STAP|nr:YkyA family protein [Staphylococcus canis]MBI5975807.1 hypothetical protein [Staphylococcus canis]